MFDCLETERLIIRRFMEGDLKEILRYASRCKVIDQNRNLISDGGESNAN